MRSILRLAAAGMMIAASSIPLAGTAPADDLAAKKISGTWAFNKDLSPAWSSGGRRAGGRSGGGGRFEQQGSAVPTQPRYPQGVRANPTNTEPTDAAMADLTPEQRTELLAMRQVHLVMPTVTIDATASHVLFTDDRGDSECNITGKTEKLRMYGAWLDVKCRWDKGVLRQEFSTARTRLIRTWTVDDRGLLVMTTKIEGLDRNSIEVPAYFDRVR